MNPHHVSTEQTKLEALSYPGVGQRMVEVVMGSVRRDALTVLRGASQADFEPSKTPPSLTFKHGDGEVRFTCGDGLEAVHVTSPRGSLHLAGSCDMAQRLTRFAVRALTVHLARAKNDCVKEVLTLLAGDDHGQALSCSHKSFRRNEHHGDGYDCGDIEHGSITTQNGVLTLSSEKRIYRIGGSIGQQMDYDRYLAVAAREQNRILASPYPSGSTMGVHTLCREDYPLPPSSAGEINSAQATFSNARIEAMLKLLGAYERMGETDLDRQTVRAALTWAKKMQASQ
jgi:hypothetical protein